MNISIHHIKKIKVEKIKKEVAEDSRRYATSGILIKTDTEIIHINLFSDEVSNLKIKKVAKLL